jgi:hypothetical protein
MGAIDQAKDAAFSSAIGAYGADLNQHTVAMHGVADERWRYENVTGQVFEAGAQRFGVGQDEAVAVAMHTEAPDDRVFSVRGGGQGVAVRVDPEQAASGDQAIETIVQFTALLAVDAEFADELLEAGGSLGLLLNFLQNGGVGEHGGLERLSHSA